MARIKIENISEGTKLLLGLLGAGETFEYNGILCIKTNKPEGHTKHFCVMLIDGNLFALNKNEEVCLTEVIIKYKTIRETEQC